MIDNIVFEVLWILFWLLTYVSIIIYGIKNRDSVFMPFLAGSLNLSCEIVSFIVKFSIGAGWLAHVLCIALDIFVFAHNVSILKRTKKSPYLYILFTFVSTALLYIIFNLPYADFMLLSIFLIDLEMAIVFLLEIKKLSPQGRSMIGCLRFLGDLFAWFGYMDDSIVVLVIGLFVAALDLLYICYSLELSANKNTKGARGKQSIPTKSGNR